MFPAPDRDSRRWHTEFSNPFTAVRSHGIEALKTFTVALPKPGQIEKFKQADGWPDARYWLREQVEKEIDFDVELKTGKADDIHYKWRNAAKGLADARMPADCQELGRLIRSFEDNKIDRNRQLYMHYHHHWTDAREAKGVVDQKSEVNDMIARLQQKYPLINALIDEISAYYGDPEPAKVEAVATYLSLYAQSKGI